MTTFEILTICIALLAVIVSATSLYRTTRVSREQLDLQRATAALASKQLAMLQNEEESSSRARLTFRLESQKPSAKFIIENVGSAPASNVSFELFPQGSLGLPSMAPSFEETFPIPTLAPGSSVSAQAYFTLASATAFKVFVRWVDADGQPREQETYVSL